MNTDYFLNRTMYLATNFGDLGAREITRICLMDIGMPCDLDGYRYIACGAALLHENPNAMITKHIYPAIAKELGCTSMQVETSCRRAIGIAYNMRNENWSHYFSNDKKPSNNEFFRVMCEILDFWEVCKKSDHMEEIAKTPLGLG